MSFAWPRGIRSGVIGRSLATKRLKQRSKQHLIEALEPRHLMAVAAVPNQPLRVAAQPIAIESGLIDSDPAIDLVTLNSAGTLSVALNGANGSWRSLRDDDLGLGQAYGMTAGALDGNPSLDLVVIGASTARVLVGDGNGGFTLGDTLRAPSGGRWRPTDNGRAGAAIGLLNRDTFGDIVLLDTANNQVAVWYGSNDRIFSAPIAYATGGIDPTSVAVADVIGDQQPDIVIGHRDGSITFLEGATNGRFELKPASTLRGATPIRALTTSDIDNDGDTDIAVAAQTEAYVLLRDASPLPRSPINNGNFTNGLTGWQFSSVGQAAGHTAGSASALSGVLQLRENGSLLTSVSQSFIIPANPRTITIDILSLGLEAGLDGAIPDAFELSLLADNNSSLVPTHRPAATSFFNASATSGVANTRMASGVEWDGRRVTLDISGLTSGTQATLVMDLVGNPPGELSTVQIDAVSISPASEFSRTFARVPLVSNDSTPMRNAVDVSVGDVDGDHRTDVVLADQGGRLWVMNGGEPGTFNTSFIPASTLGGNPLAISLDGYRAASFATEGPLDAALVLDSSARVATTLGADTTPPQAIFLSPAPSERLSSLSEVRVQFSESVIQRATSDHSVTNLNAWSIYEFGPDGQDDRGLDDDRRLPLTGVNYDAATRIATVGIAAAARPLVEGRYGLLVRGQDPRYAIQDLFGNNLNGGTDAVSSFLVDRRPGLGTIETSPALLVEGQSVTLQVPLVDGVLGGPYSIAINWGDGSAVTNLQLTQPGVITANHTYAQRGSYTARVIATDAFNQKTSVSRTLTISEDKGIRLPNIDFERDADGRVILSPALLVNQYAKYGISVTAVEDHHDDEDHHDSHGDDDVAPTIVNWYRSIDRSTPGGAAAGNVLVIGEQDSDDDHDDSQPSNRIDIEAGTLTFRFQTPVMLDEVKLLGIKHANFAKLQAYSASGARIASTQVWGSRTGAAQTAVLNATKVSKLTVQFSGRGAIAELIFSRSSSLLSSNQDDKSGSETGSGSILPGSQSNLGGGIAIGQVVTSSLSAGQTVDWTFSAVAGQKIYVNFQTLSDELLSELLDPTLKLLTTAFSARASGHDSGTLTVETTGTYTLRLNASVALTYQFQIFNVPAPDVNPITVGQVQSGALNSPGRPDHWTFQGQVGQRYYLDFLTLDTVVGGDLVVEVTQPSGLIISERFSTRASGLDQSFELTESGQITIVMRAIFDGSHLPAYTFRLTTIPADDVRNLAFRAVAIGQIEVPGARDQWRLNVPTDRAGQRIFFDMQSISPADVRVQILAQDGTVLSDRTFSLASGLDRELLIESAGQLTIIVDAAGSPELINYQFQVWDIPRDVTRTGFINTTLSGTTVPGEVARYEFEATAGTPVLLDIIESNNRVLGVTLIAPDGQTLIQRASTDVLLNLPTTGTYQALVGRASPDFLDGAGPYAFRIQDRSSPTIGGPDNLGTRFYVAFPPNLRQPFGANNPAFSLTIAGPRSTSGTVQIPGIGFTTSFSVVAGQSTRIELPSDVELADSDVIVDKAVLITALDEVAVYGLDQMQESTDGFTALPTDVIGRDYYVLGYANTIDYLVGGGTSLTLAAALDDTRVTITPTVAVGSRAAGVPFTITLNAGQAYTLHTSLPFLADLSGTRVTSTRAVSLLGGNTAARVPVGRGFADHLIEQLPPTETWGSRFLTKPLATRIGGDTFRFLAQSNNTQVRINGQLVATLNAGEFDERILPQASLIESSEPILVAQYSNSTEFDGVISDPFMMLIPPVEQYLNDYTLSTPSTGINNNFANLIVPTRAISSVTMDGVAVAADKFQPIGSSGFSGAQLPISIGSHRFRSSEPLGVSIYGFAAFDSYGYFGGMSLSRVALADRLTLSPPTATVPIGTTHFVTAAVSDAGGNPLRGVRVDFLIAESGVPATESRFVYTGDDGRALLDLRRTSSTAVTVTAQVGLLNAQATVTWQAVAPTIEIASPAPNSQLPLGQQLISGTARAGSPDATIVEVTLNGRHVDALDGVGNFFAPIDLKLGTQSFVLTAIDSRGAQASTTLTLTGLVASGARFDVTSSSDITTTTNLIFSHTTFNRQLNRLAVESQIVNAGQQPIERNVAFRFDNLQPSRVTVLNPDDVTAGSSLSRKPLMIFDTELPADGLLPGEKSLPLEVQFVDVDRDRIAIKTSLLATRNRAPQIVSIPEFQATLGQTYRYAAQANDADGGKLTYSLLVAPTGMAINANTGLVVWTPRTAQAGINQVTVQVSDSRGGVAVQRFAISAQTAVVNRPPLFVTTPITQVTPGAAYRYASRATDADRDTLSYSLTSAPLGMSIVASTGVITYPAAVAGNYAVEVQASDGRGGVATQRFQLRVGTGTAVSSPNILSRPPVVGQSDSLYVYSLSAVDPRQSPLSYSLGTAPSGMTIDAATGRVTWTPTAAQIGTHLVRIEVRSAAGGFAAQSYSVEIRAARPNAAPQFTSDPVQLATVGSAYQYVAVASDTEGQTVRYTLSRGPLGMTIDSVTGVIRWTPTADQLGTQGVIVVATDSVTGAAAGRATQQFTITVRGANTAPVFTTTPILTAAVGSIYRYDASATDTEDEVTYSLASAPNGMLIDSRSGAITFAPGVSSIGSRVVTIRARDARGLATDQRYTLVVSDDTEPPNLTIAFSSNTINVGESVRIRVVATDGSGVQSVQLTIDGQPIALDGLRGVTWLATRPGIPAIEATARDTRGNVAIQRANPPLRVIDPADTTPPEIEINSPAASSVLTYITDVVGSVRDENLEFYRLEVSLSGQDEWRAISTRTFASAPGPDGPLSSLLGQFDPTLLANDLYDLRIAAQDTSGNQSFRQVAVAVEGGAKLGNFNYEAMQSYCDCSASYVDMELPLAGIPIRIARSYDTLDADFSQDFGYGWRMDIASPRIRESVRISPAEAAGGGSLVANPFRVGSRVYLNAPDGRRVGFTFEPVATAGLLGTVWLPKFRPDPGVDMELMVEQTSLTQQSDGSFSLYLFGLAYNPDRYTLKTRDQMTYTYDQFADIQLQSVEDRNGVRLTFTRDGIESSIGPRIKWERDDFGRITRLVDPADNAIVYSYTSSGDLASVTDRVGEVTSMAYLSAPAHYLESVTDARGIKIFSLIYDAEGRIVGHANALGETASFTYDLPNNQEKIVDRLGNETTLTFDDRGNITRRMDPLGFSVTTTYDANDNATSITNERGFTTRFEYDEQRNVTRVIDALGNETTTTYNAANDPLRSVDVLGHTKSATYDARGNMAVVTDAVGGTQSYSFDASGRLSSRVDYGGYLTRMTYESSDFELPSRVFDPVVPASISEAAEWQDLDTDPLGRYTRIVDQLGYETLFDYDRSGRLREVIDANGGSWTNVFQDGFLVAQIDPLGRSTRYFYTATGLVQAIVDPSGRAYQFSYDANDNVRLTIDPLGRRTLYTYNERQELTSIRDAAGGTTNYFYDAASNLISRVDANGNRTNYVYDALNRLTSASDSIGTIGTWTYDALGNVLSFTNGLGESEHYEYDALNRIVRATSPRNAVTSYEYDAMSNPVAVIDALGNRTAYVYDAKQRLTEQIDPLGSSSFFEYDAVDSLTQATDRNGRIRQFTFDPLRRTTSEKWLVGSELRRTISYSYDAVDNLLSVQDPDTDHRFTYDVLDRVVTDRALATARTPGLVLSYRYDAVGNRTSVSDGAVSVVSTYDGRDLLTTRTWSGGGVAPARVQWAYDAEGQVIATSRFADATGSNRVGATTVSRDARGRTTAMTHRNAVDAVIANYEWDYDVADRLIEELVSGQTNRYRYNAAGELIGADMGALPDESFDLDLNGNRTLGTTLGDNNRLLADGQFEYRYDAEGNVIGKTEIATGQAYSYGYDHRNRMIRFEHRDVAGTLLTAADYAYDAFDRRVAKVVTSGGVTTTMATMYDYNQTWSDYGANGIPTVRYLFGDGVDELVASWSTSTSTQWYLSDRLGSIRDVAGSNGALVNHIDYSVFGEILSQTNPARSSRFTYTGREYDAESGLYYYRYRMYDPGSGRFMSEDPLGFRGGDTNLQRFVKNSPINFLDPFGLTASIEAGAIHTKEPKEAPAKVYTACVMQEVYTSVAFAAIGIPPSPIDLAQAAVQCAVSVNPRLVKRLAAFKAYVARGGAMKLPQWIKSTQGNPLYGTGFKSGFRNWDRRIAQVQNHHLISNPVVNLLDNMGIDGLALRNRPDLQYLSAPGQHFGYEAWHRAVDGQVLDFVRRTPGLDESSLLKFIHDLYQRPDLASRIPGVNLLF